MTHRVWRWWLGALVLVLAIPLRGFAQALPPEVVNYADIVLYNGKVLTADDKFTVVDAVAVRDGKILATGASARVLAMAGPKTTKIDLKGRSVTPGFIDTHLHQAWLGQDSKAGSDGAVRFRDKKSGLEEVRQLVSGRPPGEWVFLSGPRNQVVYALTRQDLDAVAPNNPVAISTSTAEVVVNSAAIKAARLTGDITGVFTDPKTGEPTGQVRQAAVGIFTYEMKPAHWPDIQAFVPRQKQWLYLYATQGMTMIDGRAQGLSVSILRELWAKGELPTRVRIAHEFIMYNPNPEAYLRRIGNLRNFGDDWMRIFGATVGPVDGIASVGGILTVKPKLHQAETPGGDVFGPNGQNKWSEGADDDPDWAKKSTERKAVILANRYGWNITAEHSTGDLSTQIYLDAYEQAARERPLQGRWGLDHMEWLNPELLTRMQKLGTMVPSFYAVLFKNSANHVQQYGADRLDEGTVMTKSAIATGLMPVAEADTSPGRDSAPLYLMDKFMNRADQSGRKWNAKEAVTREQALRMYTTWAARYTEDEQKLGTLEPGKLADLVVLDGDFMTVPAVSQLNVDMTIVGGKMIYDRQRDGVPTYPPNRNRPSEGQ